MAAPILPAPTMVMANVEFILYAVDNLGYGSTKKTIEALQQADKVDLGRLFVAFRDKKECPRDWTVRHLGIIICLNCGFQFKPQTMVRRDFEPSDCTKHNPDISSPEYKESYERWKLNPGMNCAKCNSSEMFPSYHILWAPADQLPYHVPGYERYICRDCRACLPDYPPLIIEN